MVIFTNNNDIRASVQVSQYDYLSHMHADWSEDYVLAALASYIIMSDIDYRFSLSDDGQYDLIISGDDEMLADMIDVLYISIKQDNKISLSNNDTKEWIINLDYL